MGGLKSYLSLISLLALFSCSKEITRQNNESVDEIFTELGSDAPYLYGETYYGRKNYVTSVSYTHLTLPTILLV